MPKYQLAAFYSRRIRTTLTTFLSLVLFTASTQAGIFSDVKKRTVSISVIKKGSALLKHQGAGYLLEDNQTIVTASHVLNDAEVIVGSFGGDDDIKFELKIVKRGDPSKSETDIALLKGAPASADLPQLGTCNVKQLNSLVGYSINGIGFPWGVGFVVSPGSLGGMSEENGVFHASGGFSKGMSGGPVVNNYGQLIGMIISGTTNDEALNYIIPADAIYEFAKDALSGEPDMFCLDQCNSVAKKMKTSCSARDKSGFHSSPSARCGLTMTAPSGTFFNQNRVTVLAEHYRNISGAPVADAMKPVYQDDYIVGFGGQIGCTNAAGTGRTCQVSATVEAAYYPLKCKAAL